MSTYKIKDGWIIVRPARPLDAAGSGLSRGTSKYVPAIEAWSEEHGWDERLLIAKKFASKEDADEFMETLKGKA